ncbi:Polyketide synthase [Pyrenophora tritici-repentis]|nr:Polyketide synthase [Pyrenophora tritici-repentis]KAI0604326.1 Polyketide synthase [Pyrenophora tritici-repentis]KAI0616692.1 Polyketide synthase [Pyrenophora tritici-repentis]KAI1594867.1 Polyketide synthase module [Pyrenophora tritici-repentis]
MDLQGPSNKSHSMTLRTACSSALTCLNEACMAISRGDCEAALVGGVNLILEPGMTIAMTEQGVLSKDGSCKTFSADANGYARGEAITAIYVKPLADAICDGNPVRAVIRGTSHNVDGRTPGMSQPSTDAQEKLIRRAYEVAGITDYNATAVVECHGTGTAVGDPIEAKAVARIFGEEGVHISSIKPNLGHAEGASGLVSVIKMVLALENRTIPPNIRFTSPNPSIPFESAKLTVPVEAMPWPTGKLQRVSVNSFGIGGANAHVILDSASRFQAQPVDSYSARGPQILLHSANTIASLDRLAKSHAQFAQENPVKVGDMAYTLAFRREALPHRSFTIVKDGGVTAASTPVKSDPSSTPDVVMIFTGQGAQWPLMGRELLRGNTVFRASIQALDGYLKAVQGEDAPDYSIEEELLKAGKKSRVGMATLSQPFVSPQGVCQLECSTIVTAT